ncbi:NUDIX domain-containing protein [Streptomyces sp. NPDC050145]|uniref:NUDIX hydrolase n=1 Tax=Streptomyces sp. NPDC050145 TaxID=3365602 RepID=UPI0037BAE3D6
MPKNRVRAILVTTDRALLLIKRTRPGRTPYWVFPGGGVEPDDPDDRDALRRELREEMAADVDIIRLFHTAEEHGERQGFYLCHARRWDFSQRTGPEFDAPGRGGYELEEVPLTTEALAGLDLMPPAAAEALRRAVDDDTL